MTQSQTAPYSNPSARTWRTDSPTRVVDFHRALPGYGATRLVELPTLAADLRARRVFVKDESSRLGLPSFKILGASYAIARVLSQRFGMSDPAPSLDEIQAAITVNGPVELVAATDGNHGRAVAHIARLLGLPSRIFFPADLTEAASSAISGEGARTVQLALPYDDVVIAATDYARGEGERSVLIQDTSWPGYDTVPQWIVDGYSTLFEEIDEQLTAVGAAAVDFVAVPIGVGSLAQAAVRHYRSRVAPGPGAIVLGVEADRAPAVTASLRTGKPVTVATAATIMAGLNCGTPSGNAWPILHAGLDSAITISEDEATRAVHDLQAVGVDAGPCGAASLAGARSWARAAVAGAEVQTIVLLSTEGLSANPLPAGS